MSLGFGLEDLIETKPEIKRRSITAENPGGAVGGGARDIDHTEWTLGGYGDLGQTRKGRPCIPVQGGETVTIADIEGPGVIQHLFLAVRRESPQGKYVWRDWILRMYWDGEDEPSVEVPFGDFFCNGWGLPCHFISLPIAVVSEQSFNSYWPMPFSEHAKIEIESQHPETETPLPLFYEIDYSLVPELPENAAYFHAQFRRENPTTPGEDYTIVDGIEGVGQYVGTYVAWTALEPHWWGEGEVKFYLDGDDEYPTICGTGTETYPGGGWSFRSGTYEGPFFGHPLEEVGNTSRIPDQYDRSSFYRWHIPDPIRFTEELRAEVQQIGHNIGGIFERCDDISSVAYWYQEEPHADFPTFPDRDARLPVHNTLPDLPDQEDRLP